MVVRAACFAFVFAVAARAEEPRNGDVIFHSSRSAQSKDIEAVTGSRYSHCGLVEVDAEGVWVWEAAGTVRRRAFDDFVAAGRGGRYALHRPIAPLERSDLDHIDAELDRLQGRPYDRLFEPGDGKVYCSELVWLAYKAAGIELCRPRPMRDYPISRRLDAARKRWGASLPLDQELVSPQDLAESPKLRAVKTME